MAYFVSDKYLTWLGDSKFVVFFKQMVLNFLGYIKQTQYVKMYFKPPALLLD